MRLDTILTRAPVRLALAAALLAAAPVRAAEGDPEAGARVFLKCRSCHQIGPAAINQIGPVLNGVVGRRAGTYPAYSYSAANRNSGLVWDEATLRDYLHDPQARVPGTKMLFAGIRNERDLDNLLAYVRQFDSQGAKLP